MLSLNYDSGTAMLKYGMRWNETSPNMTYDTYLSF